MIFFFLNILVLHLIIISHGAFFYNYFLKEKISKNNLSEISLYGIIILSFFSLIINFFFPLNKIIGTFILTSGLIYFLIIFRFNQKLIKKILKNIFLTSFISVLILSYSNIYRPDAGLYHLPFISLLNESKIIIGSVNINFRFGATSIIQYLSAIQNNYLFDIKSISIPIASIFSFTIYFLFQKTLKFLHSEKTLQTTFIFLICCFSLISFGRFSNFGNDAVSHLYYFILATLLIENYKELFLDITKFIKVSLICIFLFATKAFMLMIIIIPVIIFIFHKNKNKIIYNINTILISFLFICWVLRTILISGCAIYPLEKTCLKKLKFYDHEQTLLEAKSGEAWAKDWINQKGDKLEFKKYSESFNWFGVWKNNHLKKIGEKISPFLIFLIILTLSLIINKNKFRKKLPYEIFFIFFTSLFFSILWFLKFPLYRYGLAFLIVSLIAFVIYIQNQFNLLSDKKKLSPIFKVFLFICIFVFLSKNILRIHQNITDKTNGLWPDIYSEKNNYKINQFKEIRNNDQFLYFFSGGKLCMYSKSPCSNYDIRNLNKNIFLGYKIYWKN